jgi:hypothetical protein
MDLTKEELIQKITKVQQFLEGFENLNTEKNNWWNRAENAKNIKIYIKSSVASFFAFIVCFIITSIIYDNYSRINAGVIVFGIFNLMFLFIFIGNIQDIMKSIKERIIAKNEFNGMDDKFKTFFSQNEQEINDTNEFFPGNTCPLSRHVQYGLNGLTSGRADNYKEFMNLIDDLIHREKLEYNAQVQTENTRQALAISKDALKTANAAASDASAARATANAAISAANTSRTVYINRN